MGFPENVLTSGEKVEKSLHPHWRTVVGPMVIGLSSSRPASTPPSLTPDDTTGNVIQWIASASACSSASRWSSSPSCAGGRRTTSSRRTASWCARGIVNKNGKDITLSKITDVSFSQTLLDRISAPGRCSIESAGDSPDEAFEAIPRSDRVQQLSTTSSTRTPTGAPSAWSTAPASRRTRRPPTGCTRRSSGCTRRRSDWPRPGAAPPSSTEESAETTAVSVEPSTTTTPTSEAPARSETER